MLTPYGSKCPPLSIRVKPGKPRKGYRGTKWDRPMMSICIVRHGLQNTFIISGLATEITINPPNAHPILPAHKCFMTSAHPPAIILGMKWV